MKKNPVIIIGGDHYNGLGLVRAFARFGVPAYGIIIGEHAAHGFVRKSKYWKKVFTSSKEEDILVFLEKISNETDLKPVIVPYSDGAAALIDQNYDKLSRIFIMPNIGDKEGMVFEMMDKTRQVEFAKSCGMKSAPSWEIWLPFKDLPSDLEYPLIGKPVISCQGNKKDISKLENEQELVRYLIQLKNKGYDRVLIQKYMDIEVEYDILGSIHNKRFSYVMSRKIRNWPNVGGPTSYSITIDDDIVKEAAEKIQDQLKKLHFSGLFDVDLFKVGDELYFNEINWRNSALGYIANNSRVFYQVIWYLSVLHKSTKNLSIKPKAVGKYSMNELLDYRHCLNGDMKPLKWLEQYKNCTGFAYKDKKDMYPVYCKYALPILRRIYR